MQPRLAGYLCFAFISVIWGTTYLVTRIGVTHYPAFLFTGIRQVCAGLLLLLLLKLFKVKFSWKWRDIYPQLIAGVLIIALGNGLISWSAHYIPSGLCALLCTLIPMNITLISLARDKGRGFNKFMLLGLLTGLMGMLFIFKDNITDLGKPEYLIAIIVTIVATVCWSAGSVYSKNNVSSCHPLYKAALQLFTGGTVLLIVSVFSEKWQTVSFPDSSALKALIYLIVFGSLAAFAAYQYALKVLPAGLVAVYAYVNPTIAVVLGNIFANERLTVHTAAAFAFTVCGVILVNYGYFVQRQHSLKMAH